MTWRARLWFFVADVLRFVGLSRLAWRAVHKACDSLAPDAFGTCEPVSGDEPF